MSLNPQPADFASFYLYHGLGNDYLVLEASQLPTRLTPQMVQRLCDRHFGLGADGILLNESSGQPRSDADNLAAGVAEFHLRILNPDGSEAEKSGNGLRIFSRYLCDVGAVRRGDDFSVHTVGGRVTCQVLPDRDAHDQRVRVQMGQASFSSGAISMVGPEREVLNETLHAGGRDLAFCAVSVGNPHCVVLGENWSDEDVQQLGPIIENDPRFRQRTNVQFVEVLTPARIKLSIWERGAGYTLASGSSSCAAAAVCHRLGLCGSRINAQMPGGELALRVDPDFNIEMEGPVVAIARGVLSNELLA